MFFAWFSMITFLLLSGFMTPVDNIPAAIRSLVAINPTYYMMSIIREVIPQRQRHRLLLARSAGLLAITVVLGSISLTGFRRLVRR